MPMVAVPIAYISAAAEDTSGKNGVCVVFLNAGEAGERLPLGKSVQFCAYLLFVGALAARLSDG